MKSNHNRTFSFIKSAKFFLVLSLFAYLWPPGPPVFGFFLRYEYLFQTLILVALLLFLGGIVFTKDEYKEPLAQVKAIVKNPSSVDIGAIVFLAAFFLATVFSVNFERSFFGSDRLTGFVNLLHVGVLYALVRVLFSTKEGILRLLKYVAIVSGLIALYALGQKAGIIEYGSGSRPAGTFTNPAILASYFIFTIFLSLFGYLRVAKQRDIHAANLPHIFLGAAGLGVLAIIITQTRGALVGLVVGIAVFLVFQIFSKNKTPLVRRGSAAALILITFAILLGGVQAIYSPLSVSEGLLYRLTNREALTSGLANRVISSQIALEAFSERPIFGWGPENFASGFEKYFDTRLVQVVELAEAWFDKAHNIFVDMLATTGIVGLIAFLYFLGVIFYTSLRRVFSDKAYIAVLALVVAYAVNGLVIFDTVYTWVMLFLLAALLANDVDTTRVSRVPVTASHRIIAGVLAVPVVYGLFFLNIIPMKGLGYHYQGWEGVSNNEMDAVLLYKKDFDLPNRYAVYGWQRLSELLLNSKSKIDDDVYQQSARFAFSEFEQFKSEYTGAQHYYMASRIGNFISDTTAEEDARILEYIKAAITLSPEKPDLYYEIAQYYKNRGDREKSLEYLLKIRDIDPKIPFTYINLGLSYAEVRNFDDAVVAFDKAIELGYDRWRDNPFYVNLFIELFTIDDYIGDYMHRLPDFYEAMIVFEPEEVTYYIQLASVYKELGEIELAREWALEAIKVNSEVKPAADAFIQSLTSK